MIVKQFAIQELSLGEPVVGVAARLAIEGRATLGPPSEGLDLALNAKRLDAGGELKALLSYVPDTDKLTVSIEFRRARGRHIRPSRQSPGLPPANFRFDGAGPLDNFDAKLDFSAGADVWAKGDVHRRPPGRRRGS